MSNFTYCYNCDNGLNPSLKERVLGEMECGSCGSTHEFGPHTVQDAMSELCDSIDTIKSRLNAIEMLLGVKK